MAGQSCGYWSLHRAMERKSVLISDDLFVKASEGSAREHSSPRVSCSGKSSE